MHKEKLYTRIVKLYTLNTPRKIRIITLPVNEVPPHSTCPLNPTNFIAVHQKFHRLNTRSYFLQKRRIVNSKYSKRFGL